MTILPVAALAIACSDGSKQAGTGGNGGNGGTGGVVSVGGGGGCGVQPGGNEPPPGSVCIERVSGSVIDAAEGAIVDLLMSSCGPAGCEPDNTDSSGAFDISVGFPLFVADYAVIPHGRELGKLTFYFALPDDHPGPVIDLGNLRLLDAPTDGPSMVVKTDAMGAPAQTVTSGDVTMDVPAGVRINLDFEDVILGAEGKKFKALKVPAEYQDEYVDPSLGIVALYAFSPFDASFDEEANPGTLTRVQLSFANTTGLAADTTVEFLELGSYVIVNDVAPAAFEVVATGAVSSDGTTIDMDPGQGVEYLTWIAIR